MRRRKGGSAYPYWLLVLITGSGTMPVHIFVPALPLLAAEFGIDAGTAQLTTSTYLMALAVGQIAYGPLSDRFGRRPVLIAGLTLYALCGVGAALAHTFTALLAARVLQALGGCCGLVLGRAIVHDVAHGEEAASKMAVLNTVLLLSPSLAPIIGLTLAGWFGWRAIPLVLAMTGTSTVIGAWFLIRETVRERAASPRQLAIDYLKLMVRPRFMAFAVGGALGTTTHFILLSTGPFIVVDVLHRPLAELSYFYAAWICGLIVGGMLARWLIRPVGMNRLMIASALLSAASGSALLVLAAAGALTPLTLIASGSGFTMAAGLLSPLSVTRSIAEGGKLIGSASGLYGFAQMTTGSIAITLVSLHENLTVTAGALMAAAGLGALILLSWGIASEKGGGRLNPPTRSD